MPIHPDDLPDAGGNHFQPAAIQVQAIDLGMPLGWHADVARCADLEIELLVGADGEKLPTVRFVLRQIDEDDGRLRRIVELVFDVVDFRDLRQLGDVERPLVQDDAVGAVKPRGDDLDLARSALVDDGVDLVLEAARDEHRALIAEAQRARVVDAARIDIDGEAFGRLELVERQLVGCDRDWRRGDRRELLGGRSIGPADQRRAGRQRSRLLGGWRRSLLLGRRRRSLLLGGRRRRSGKQATESAGEYERRAARHVDHDLPPFYCRCSSCIVSLTFVAAAKPSLDCGPW